MKLAEFTTAASDYAVHVDALFTLLSVISAAVVALVGPDLRYLTGATVPLDGGQAFFG